ncbi:MAG: ankyrin repeat domain-containing protein [Proteobacteria bacterium]|nr:ankyrin repeat domain-containing protein [Pseudomonadota bacterium]HQR05092.1 ankyrin repeat domain-containing protein [Rhodocyclaceae bacterium]
MFRRLSSLPGLFFFLVFSHPAALHAALPDPAALGVAAEVGDTGRIGRWLDEGMSPDALADRIGTPLMIAAWEGNISLMEYLVSRGARVNAMNAHGEQALMMAAWKGQKAAVAWLLDHGAQVSRPGLQWSALHYAVFAGHGEVAQLLMARGADVNGRAPNGSTVLMMAAREGHEALAHTLLEAGADPRPVNERGDSALSWAMRYNNLRIARLISSPEEFARAARLPPESFGVAIRSVPPPGEIAEILRQIRVAQAEGRPVEELRQALFAAVDTFRHDAASTRSRSKIVAPRGLVITADRKQAGAERVEVVNAGARSRAGVAPALPPTEDPAELLRRLRLADAAGQPTAELRRQFLDAVRKYQGGPRAP